MRTDPPGGERPDRASTLAGLDTRLDSETWLRIVFQNTPDVILTTDRGGTIRFINHTYSRRPVEEVVGTSAFDYPRSSDRNRMRATFEEVVSTKAPLSVEVSSESNAIWLIRLIPLPPSQEVEGVLMIATDITERKRSEEALRESEGRFRSLAESMTAAIFIFQDEKIVYANSSGERITGYTRTEMARMKFRDLIHPDDRELAPDRGIRGQRGAAGPGRYELKILTKAGEERWVDYSANPFEHANAPAILGTAIDVTERKRAEEAARLMEAQLQHAWKLESLGVLASGLAHDFNNLLTGIVGSASLAATKVESDSPAAQQLDRILKAAQKAAELTNKMLAYAGKGQFDMGPTDLNHVVEEVVPLVRASIENRASLRLCLAPNLPTIEADPAQLHKVVLNLLANAAEALEEEGSPRERAVEKDVLVRTGAMTHGQNGSDETQAWVFLEVRDEGVGMDEETRQRIFEPFFSTKFTGRGLGLAAVQGIVRAHRGLIRVESAPGRGSTFTVLFPARSRSSDAETTNGNGSVSKAAETILVVDDETTVRDVARISLEERGFNVLTAADGPSAIALFEKCYEEVDAVLLDLTMPLLSGERTLDALLRLKPGLRVVLTSGHDGNEVAKRFGGRALAGFVQKPFRPRDLVARIEQALAKPAP